MLNQMLFFSELNGMLGRIIRAGRRLQSDETKSSEDLIDLCGWLMSDRGEATGLAIAQQIFDEFSTLDEKQQDVFFNQIAAQFDVDENALEDILERWIANEITPRQLHFATEPRSMELFRRLNRVPGGTRALVSMRALLLDSLKRNGDLNGINQDLQHLLSVWFNRGFLELRRISWSTSAEILEKVISYEAVHEIKDWKDLRQRVASPDRRLYAFFHPVMPTEPLIFVEVALTRDIPKAIAPVLSKQRDILNPDEANTAVFYSISNCQKGLRGISFGNFLIKLVVEKLDEEFKSINRFITLSPVPGFRQWLTKVCQNEETRRESLPVTLVESMPEFSHVDQPDADILKTLVAWYLVKVKKEDQTAINPVAHFHLGNGASLHAIHLEADTSNNGIRNAWGVMVNYLYDNSKIEAHHENYINQKQIVVSDDIQALLKAV